LKILQVVYPGLGGSASVAFSLVEGQKDKIKYKNYFLFYGVENLLIAHKKNCKKLNINYNFIKKKKINLNFFLHLNYCNKILPDVIIVHDINILPFFIYIIFKRTKIIFVHHTPDKTKNFFKWINYFINGVLSNFIVLVSRRDKNDFMFKINKIFFSNKTNIIENGINTTKFMK
jgi:hypothetical protein